MADFCAAEFAVPTFGFGDSSLSVGGEMSEKSILSGLRVNNFSSWGAAGWRDSPDEFGGLMEFEEFALPVWRAERDCGGSGWCGDFVVAAAAAAGGCARWGTALALRPRRLCRYACRGWRI